MNRITSLKKFVRALGDLGWDKSFELQDIQMSVIKKLYRANGLEIVRTCPACPEQYDVFKDRRQIAYYRLRHGIFTVDVPDVDGNEVYMYDTDGDGMFEPHERLVQLAKVLRIVIRHSYLKANPDKLFND